MSKNKIKKVARKHEQTYVPAGYLPDLGHHAEHSVGVNIIRCIEIDLGDFGVDEQLTLNVWESRRIAKMLLAAADRLEGISR